MSRGEGVVMIIAGLVFAALGVTFVAWGNWIPFVNTVNNPAALGWIEIGLGLGWAAFGAVQLRRRCE